MRRKALLRVLPKVQDKEELLKVQRKEAPKERRKKEQPPKRAPKERPSKEVPKKEQLPKVVHLKVMLLKEERPGMPKEVARPMRKLKQILLKGRTPVAPLPKQQQQKVVELW
jgi:hypothetical protein